MSALVKGASGIGAGTLIIGGGYGLATHVISVRYTTLKESQTTLYAVGTIGGNNKDEFVDPIFEGNEKWWNYVYKNVFEEDKKRNDISISNEFENVANAFLKGISDNNKTYLNQVCHAALLKTEKTTVNTTYIQNVWRYCSTSPDLFFRSKGTEPKPKTLAEANSQVETDKLSGIGNNKNDLVADIKDNEDWWNWAFSNRLESLKKDANNISDTFKAVTSGYGTDENNSLSKVCDAQYKKPSSDFSDDSTNTDGKYKLKQDVDRFCTLGKNKKLSLS
ncbi:hypothetical protein MHSWG343_10720 [Candidatus Mycoplasma haematohominis]|uniref:Uncharacterized protein n=1 Tax=Candidatus Mycoplasma haematohominis TaxID=1494318 RepID=A0A478FSK8_9MOLU|nr:hypothetical protein MHSWG343_10720 [Candidatus Mycoplasma haemohominis]